jgi:hypothetical protein
LASLDAMLVSPMASSPLAPSHPSTSDLTPALFCPSCAGSMQFRATVLRAGADGAASEQWNRYECRTCGPFELLFQAGDGGRSRLR